jgi:hypothetical protein
MKNIDIQLCQKITYFFKASTTVYRHFVYDIDKFEFFKVFLEHLLNEVFAGKVLRKSVIYPRTPIMTLVSCREWLLRLLLMKGAAPYNYKPPRQGSKLAVAQSPMATKMSPWRLENVER